MQCHRNSNPTSTPTPSIISISNSTSKLPKFLRAPGAERDRAKSVAEMSTTSLASTVSEAGSSGKRKSRFLAMRSAEVASAVPNAPQPQQARVDELAKPVFIPRPRRALSRTSNNSNSKLVLTHLPILALIPFTPAHSRPQPHVLLSHWGPSHPPIGVVLSHIH
ncbi:hypothetical protein C0991_011020 [Blastosporella zonata]|nr:hypothetical protein C0991_011020 [Blastosporella zonata]